MISPSKRKSKLPVATSEEEIIGGTRFKDDTKPANKNTPSSVFLAFEISSDDGFATRADNWNGLYCSNHKHARMIYLWLKSVLS